jgi:FkbM family methyltransferase
MHWTRTEAIAYFLKGVARELGIAPFFFLKQYEKIACRIFVKKWLKNNINGACFDFDGAKLPDVSHDKAKLKGLFCVFQETLVFPCFFNDNYDRTIVEYYDRFIGEGPYGYINGDFDVTVKKDDIVIDAGAWIGDFSAYVSSKGATVYAFEPVNETFQLLRKTEMLNNVMGGQIYPIQQGLGDSECEMDISIDSAGGGIGDSIIINRGGAHMREKISITTLDKFVKENKLERVDFIKADIEGAERDMLKGASYVLKTFAPKLAICTYHLPDDPEVLETIILEANPNYTIVHLQRKLMAAVISK